MERVFKIQKERKEASKIFQVKTPDDVNNLKSNLLNAYETIR